MTLDDVGVAVLLVIVLVLLLLDKCTNDAFEMLVSIGLALITVGADFMPK